MLISGGAENWALCTFLAGPLTGLRGISLTKFFPWSSRFKRRAYDNLNPRFCCHG